MKYALIYLIITGDIYTVNTVATFPTFEACEQERTRPQEVNGVLICTKNTPKKFILSYL